MKRIIILFVLFTIYITSVTALSWDRMSYLYEPEREMGVCIKTSLHKDIIYNTWTLNLEGYSFSNYGNKTHVDFSCRESYDSILHSHPPQDKCVFSQYDVDWFNSTKKFKRSVLYCYDGQIKYMFKHKGVIQFQSVIEKKTLSVPFPRAIIKKPKDKEYITEYEVVYGN